MGFPIVGAKAAHRLQAEGLHALGAVRGHHCGAQADIEPELLQALHRLAGFGAAIDDDRFNVKRIQMLGDVDDAVVVGGEHWPLRWAERVVVY